MNKIKKFFRKIEDFLMDLYGMDKHMKKLILILLLPAFSFGQTSSGDGVDIDLKFMGTTAGETNIAKVQVNDTIILGLDINNLSSDNITYIHTDVEYNTAAYVLTNSVWNVPADAQESVFTWNDTKWTPTDQYDHNDLWAQWNSGQGSYNQTTGWNVDHWQVISPTSFSGVYVELYFLVKDTDVSNYDKAINVTMARVSDNTQTPEYVFPYGAVRAYATQEISNVPLEDLDSNIYLKVDFNTNIDPTKVKLVVYEDDNIVGTSVLDANGDANITDFITKSDASYTYDFVWNGSEEELKTLRDNLVTISDVVLTLKEAGEFDHGNTGQVFGPIQYITGDVNMDQSITGQDAFNSLGHVLGTLDLYQELDTFEEFSAVVPASFYNGLSVDDLFGTEITEPEPPTIDFSAGTNVLNYKAAMFGDANLSHTSAQDNTTSVNVSAKTFQYGMTMKGESFIDANFTTGIENGEVVATIELLSNDTKALQLKLDFDNTRLAFKEAVFDTGNTTTNFGAAENSRVNVGSINQQSEAIPSGSTIKVVFTGNVDSTVGLISIFNTDAASIEGLQQILRLQ